MKTFKCKICGTIVSSEEKVETCEACGADEMTVFRERKPSNIDWHVVACIAAKLSVLGIVLGTIGLSIWMVLH